MQVPLPRLIGASASGVGRIAIACAGLCVLLSCAPKDDRSSVHTLAIENKMHSLEIPLARKNVLYLVVAFRRQTIQVKIRGVVLREFSILKSEVQRPWEELAVIETLRRRGIAPDPSRTIIAPPRNPANGDDTESVMIERVEDSLELEDMPSFFTLEFESGSQILVLSRSKHPLGFLQKTANFWVRALFFFKRIASPGSPAATVILDADDSRALYWAVLNQKDNTPLQKIVVGAPA